MATEQGQVIIYGAGKKGKLYYDFLEKYKKSGIVIGFCDKDYKNIASVEGTRVMSFDEACSLHMPFLISIANKEISNGVKDMIANAGEQWLVFDDMADYLHEDRVELNREWCAYIHNDQMENYYDEAEGMQSIDVFWGAESPFLEQFKKLNLENVIELACGRGRHVLNYREKAGTITLVDILEKNISFCERRFGNENMQYYCNNGYNLEKLESEKYTALFCYDAMVHFEMMDIYEYLKDIHRVLVPGGMALIHHSNNTSDYKASFNNAPHGRSFLSKDIFAYLAYRTGFKVLQQKVIDWGVMGVDYYPELDCISLIQK